MRLVIVAHLILLALASTNFTIVTRFLGGEHFEWLYYKYQFESGFGAVYQSPFSVAVIVTYLLAFAAGAVGFSMAIGRGRQFIGGWGLILSVLGLVSFGIEASHWFSDHQRSWLVFSPGLMLVLSILALLPAGCCRSHRKIAEPSTCPQV
jgi:hypothetical protein